MIRPDEEPPPLLGTWNRLYGVLLTTLVLQIVFFWLLTRAYT